MWVIQGIITIPGLIPPLLWAIDFGPPDEGHSQSHVFRRKACVYRQTHTHIHTHTHPTHRTVLGVLHGALESQG